MGFRSGKAKGPATNGRPLNNIWSFGTYIIPLDVSPVDALIIPLTFLPTVFSILGFTLFSPTVPIVGSPSIVPRTAAGGLGSDLSGVGGLFFFNLQPTEFSYTVVGYGSGGRIPLVSNATTLYFRVTGTAQAASTSIKCIVTGGNLQ